MVNKPLQEQGVTLLELIVTLSILSVLAYTAIPAFENIQNSYHRFNSRSYLIQDLRRAQAFALSEGCRGIFTVSTDRKSYSFGCDYLSYDISHPPRADNINFLRELPPSILIDAPQTIIFDSRGAAVDEDGVVSSTNISLLESESGVTSTFASGTLLGTGLFSFS